MSEEYGIIPELKHREEEINAAIKARDMKKFREIIESEGLIWEGPDHDKKCKCDWCHREEKEYPEKEPMI